MKFFCLILVLPVLLHAARPPEWFKRPAPDEPRPGDVSAWILHDSLMVRQESATTVVYRQRQAVMPLSDAGVKKILCNLTFTAGAEELVSARAWAMSPDGKKCRAFGGDEFLVYSPTVSNEIWDLTKSVLFLPERYLEPGWIFAWEVEIRSNFGRFDTRWSPENPLPVKFASLEIVPVEGGEVKWKALSPGLPDPVAGSAPGALVWRSSDLPGFKGEIPEGVARRVKELGAYMFAPGASASDTKSWSDVVRLVRAEMDPKTVSSPVIDAEAKRLGGGGNLWNRIRPLCDFVRKEIVYLLVVINSDSMAGYRPHTATEVFENRYGDCKDKAVLLCTMLNAIGAEARVMLVNSGAPKHNTVDWPSAQFNHAIVAIRASEAVPPGWTVVRVENIDYVLFDPTNPQVPLGLLPVYDTGGLGLVLAPAVSAPVFIPAIPSPAESKTTVVHAKLAEDGSALIDFTEERSGLAAVQAITSDETVTRADRTGALEKKIQRRLPLISDLSWESTADVQNHRWSAKASFAAQYAGKRVPGGLFVTTDLLSDTPYLAPWEEGTEGWFNFAPEETHREFHLSVPAGWEFAEVPPDWSLKTNAGEGTMHYSSKEGTLSGEIRLRVAGGVLDRPAYLATRDLLHAAVVAERRPVILRRVAATAGAAVTEPRAAERKE